MVKIAANIIYLFDIMSLIIKFILLSLNYDIMTLNQFRTLKQLKIKIIIIGNCVRVNYVLLKH